MFSSIGWIIETGSTARALSFSLKILRRTWYVSFVIVGWILQADFDRLVLSTNPYLEKNLEFLTECLDDLQAEQQKLSFFNRNQARQAQQQAQWLQKRRWGLCLMFANRDAVLSRWMMFKLNFRKTLCWLFYNLSPRPSCAGFERWGCYVLS